MFLYGQLSSSITHVGFSNDHNTCNDALISANAGLLNNLQILIQYTAD
jgi:hypothetical protein